MKISIALRSLLLAIGLMASGVLVAAQEAGGEEDNASEAAPPASGIGAICWAAIVENGYQVASRCDFGERSSSPETIAAYEKARSELAERFLASGWTRETLDRFRAHQGNADVPTDQLCGFDRDDNDTGSFLFHLAQSRPENIDKTTQSVLAIPGNPKWGTCL
ncbi:MAG: hypothetical protein AAFQ27_01115 [Pseudomonadota bacterium]